MIKVEVKVKVKVKVEVTISITQANDVKSFVFFVYSFMSFVVNGFQFFYFFSKAASKAISEEGKSTFLTNSQASLAPNSLSIPLSSHSTDKGPLYLIVFSALIISSKSTFP
jgi:hypothetical protein